MIGRLHGVLVERDLLGRAIVDVQGVGYEVHLPSGATVVEGASVTLFVHTHVREDALLLYAFLTREDRDMFLLLLSVSTVGPKLALAVLGRLEAPALADAIARKDASAFRGISGVGKRTVERLLLELHDKVTPWLGQAAGTLRPAGRSKSVQPGAQSLTRHPLETQVVGALVSMGYKQHEAEHAVDAAARALFEVGPQDETISGEDLLRRALSTLAS